MSLFETRLLRVLADGQFYRVGGHSPIKVDVRIIAATHQNLEEQVELNSFREDLYHRLSVILIKVPTLNERTEDIPELTNHFIKQICNEYGMPEKTISDEAIEKLQGINWTGNIREFRNVIERLIILGNKSISAEDVEAFATSIK